MYGVEKFISGYSRRLFAISVLASEYDKTLLIMFPLHISVHNLKY